MIKLKKAGYNIRVYFNGGDTVHVDIYKPTWIFFETFLIGVNYKRDESRRLKDYVEWAIIELEELYS